MAETLMPSMATQAALNAANTAIGDLNAENEYDGASAASLTAAIEAAIDALSNDSKMHVITVIKGAKAILLVQKYSSGSYASYVGFCYALTNPINGEKVNGTWTHSTLALKNEAMDFYMSGISSSSTLTSQILAYTKANFKGRTGITVRFFISAASAPSDIPANTNVWKYSFGEFKVRTVPGNGDAMDGMLILYGFGANNIAIKACSNDNFASQWTILG